MRSHFLAVSLADELTVSRGDGEPGFFCDDPSVPELNTVTKTLRLASEAVDLSGFRWELKKRIPVESGLGGGSSDAAGALRACRRLFPEAFPDHLLREIARAVGSDVPFFLVGGAARAEGYGERLTSLPDLPSVHLVLAQPSVGCSTVEAYRALDAKPRDWREFPEDPLELYNDFERVAPCGSLDLIERLQIIGASSAGLTGSGSAVFGFFPDEQTAGLAADRLASEEKCWTFAGRTLTREESLWMS
ncbi:MAG: hypothetical protein MH204_01755 [Fimbriimonadaceae bacterium]|nr:hypothetical protein [Fimbriimonadaceae bacterium]